MFTSHRSTFSFRCALYQMGCQGWAHIVKTETAQAEWGWHALDFACSSFFATHIKPRQNTFPSFATNPLPPSPAALPSTSLHPPAAQWDLCSAGNLSLTAHHAFLLHHQTSHHLTYRNIHTSCTKDAKRHQKVISHRRVSITTSNTCFGGDFV